MKIKTITINRFRGYSMPVTVEFKDLIILVGRNDIGKSTILEALDIFFNEGKGCVKLDKHDINKDCLDQGEDCIEIDIEFIDLPKNIIIDATNQTTLKDEYLLSSAETLHVVKKYPNAGKEKVFIRANHPINPDCADLLLKKNAELKKILGNKNLNCQDKTKNAELRKAIWNGQEDLKLEDREIEVTKIDDKIIWNQLKSYMPLYTLFQSDRKNKDSDDEVQDPMRIAVKEILDDPKIKEDLAQVTETVKERLDQVAKRTLQKLEEMNSDIANSLAPELPDFSTLKWSDVFKNVSITGDNSIPINKRGSGVKRLVLISFFRAEAERRQNESKLPDIVYAIEEPETSQHPKHQRALTEALIALSNSQNTQVLLTTHSPEIVKLLKFENIFLVSNQEQDRVSQIIEHELPYPSLNEVNHTAFNEPSPEYHNELYGYIESKNWLKEYTRGKSKMLYKKDLRGKIEDKYITLTEYIRHQIHHPENENNSRFDTNQLKESIDAMRSFIQNKKLTQNPKMGSA